MKVAAGNIVRITYELKVKGGEVIESSEKTGSMEYTHGGGKMLPALEKRLEGMAVGEEKKGTIPAAEAFPESSLPTTKMLKKEFPASLKVDNGLSFEAKGPDGKPIAFKVVEVKGDDVTVRLMPTLFGKDLDFRMQVLSIDDPKARRRSSVAPPPPPVEALELSPDDIQEG